MVVSGSALPIGSIIWLPGRHDHRSIPPAPTVLTWRLTKVMGATGRSLLVSHRHDRCAHGPGCHRMTVPRRIPVDNLYRVWQMPREKGSASGTAPAVPRDVRSLSVPEN